jgi:ABC-type multidrug transport system ATPase subunit
VLLRLARNFVTFAYAIIKIVKNISILLTNSGKRYNTEWIFRNINYTFQKGNNYVILGPNGSGKSTLLQLLAGNSILSEGKVEYSINDQKVSEEDIFRHISYAAPYLDLPEEFTLNEMIEFHGKFKKYLIPPVEVLEKTGLASSANKFIKYFSSGMKQRVKLSLAIMSDTPILFLDEPASNLDKQGIDWYQKLVAEFAKEKLIVVCSNHQTFEYEFCKEQLHIEEFKP